MKAALLPLLLSLLAVQAAANDAAPVLYARGDYAGAAKAGEAAGSATGYALTARAVLSDAVLRDSPCMECLERAEALAQRAIAVDPKLAEAQIWLASALGYQTRIQGMGWARLHGLPTRARAALDAAVAAAPGNALAVSALAGWHVEVVKGAGPFLARTLYGASLGEAMTLFDRAVTLAPGEEAVRYQIALALAGLDPDAHRARIASELEAALKATPVTAYERAQQGRAAELKALLGGNRPAFDAKVRKFQGYP